MQLGFPRDPTQWLAVGLGAAAWLGSRWLVGGGPRRERVVVAIAAVAALLGSIGYVAVYLRGGPRIVDATSYWLEARALAAGHFAWPLGEPAASTMGRFLVRAGAGDAPTAAVIFPPGWPAVLALGFLAGAPLLVGPLLGAALVVATAELARWVARAAGGVDGPAPRVAALLSACCAALRYHTADTMSHGLAATCVATALVAALRGRDGQRAIAAAPAPSFARRLAAGGSAWFALSGGTMGLLVATRPFSALALALPLAAALFVDLGAAGPRRAGARPIAIFGLAALPGVVLLVAHQHAATSVFGASSQALYYASADGPPGCFRWGFGPGIGCLGEHGDFVRARLPAGFGALAALGTTLRRLRLHLLDFANGEPLFALVPLAAVVVWRAPLARILVGALAASILAYAPFYFDGNYPGGGARFYAELLPLEHALVAAALVVWAQSRSVPLHALVAIPSLALLGFATRAGFEHALLRDREGGRPMFEPAVLAAGGVTSGLVFVDTDHGFSLAAEPWRSGAALRFARWRGDAVDRLEWEARGRPPAYRYRYRWEGDDPARVDVEAVDVAAAPLRIEAETLWPAVDQRGAFALPEHASGTCASAGRWLAVRRAAALDSGEGRQAALDSGEGRQAALDSPSVTLALPRALGGRAVAPRLGPFRGEAGVQLLVDGQPRAGWFAVGAPECTELTAVPVPPGAHDVALRIDLRSTEAGETVLLDAIVLEPMDNR